MLTGLRPTFCLASSLCCLTSKGLRPVSFFPFLKFEQAILVVKICLTGVQKYHKIGLKANAVN